MSAITFLAPLAQSMAERSHQSNDAVQKFTGAQTKSQPLAKEFSRLLQCDMMRAHHLSQLKKRRNPDVKGQENPSLASDDRLHFPGVEAAGDWSHNVQQPDDPSQENPSQTSGERLQSKEKMT